MSQEDVRDEVVEEQEPIAEDAGETEPDEDEEDDEMDEDDEDDEDEDEEDDSGGES